MWIGLSASSITTFVAHLFQLSRTTSRKNPIRLLPVASKDRDTSSPGRLEPLDSELPDIMRHWMNNDAEDATPEDHNSETPSTSPTPDAGGPISATTDDANEDGHGFSTHPAGDDPGHLNNPQGTRQGYLPSLKSSRKPKSSGLPVLTEPSGINKATSSNKATEELRQHVIQRAAYDQFARQEYEGREREADGSVYCGPSSSEATRYHGPFEHHRVWPPLYSKQNQPSSPSSPKHGETPTENQQKPSFQAKKSRLSAAPEPSKDPVPQGVMMIDMDAVPLEYRQLVAQWCKPMPADGHDRANNIKPIAAEPTPSNENPTSTTTDNPSKAIMKRGFQDEADEVDRDTTSNKKRVRSCGEMSLYQSCYSQPAHPAQPYGAVTPQPETTTTLNKQSESTEKRAHRTPSPRATKSASSPRATSNASSKMENPGTSQGSQAARGSKRKNQLEHAGSRNLAVEELEVDEARTSASAVTLEGRQMASASSPSRSHATRGSKRKSQLEHDGFRDSAADAAEDSDIEERNQKASAAVLATRKIANPSSRFRKV